MFLSLESCVTTAIMNHFVQPKPALVEVLPDYLKNHDLSYVQSQANYLRSFLTAQLNSFEHDDAVEVIQEKKSGSASARNLSPKYRNLLSHTSKYVL